MNKESILKFFNTIKAGTIKHSPEIMTGIGIAGMITTTVLAVKATPKALMLIDNKKQEIFDELDPSEVPDNNTNYKDLQLKPIEVVKVAWKPYIPAAVTCVASVTCLIGASSVNAKRNAALATAYELSKTALTEYKEKVVETIGDEKEKVVREKVSEERIKKNPITKNEIIMTDYGDTQFYETLSGRYFKSDIEQIKKVVNYLNKDMLRDMFGTISLNEFYDELELERIDLGDELGWRVDKGPIEIDFTSKIADNGKPCIVLDYINAPHYGFNKFG